MPTPTDGHAVAAELSTAFSHLVWVPDTHIGRWEQPLSATGVPIARVCREGEAVGLAAGLMIGGARPLVAVQCTGFFEAGDAVRNVAFDLKLPLKLLVGVRSHRAAVTSGTADNCPTFAEPVVAAWGLSRRWFDPFDPAASASDAIRWLAAEPGPAVLLWSE